MEWADPVLENGRITVRNNRTGTVAWTSPSDLSIAQHSLLDSINPSSSIDLSSSSSFGLRLFSGLIVARTYTNDLILLDGQNGKLLRRREGLPFEFAAVAKVGANNIIAYKSAGNWNPNANETFDEVFVLDTAASNVVFRGFLSNRTTPVLAFGPTLPGQILVWHVPARVPRRGQVHSYTPPRCLQVINERGENPNGWRLPRKGDTADGIYEYFLAEDLILIFNQNTGEVLAYEHDPGDAGKKQEVNER